MTFLLYDRTVSKNLLFQASVKTGVSFAFQEKTP